MTTLIRAFVLGLGVLALPAQAAESEDLAQAIQDYLDFEEYGSSLILPEQIPAADWPRLLVIDARDAGQFEREHIPGARNIEWREIPARRSEIPADQMVVIYCNSGTLSAQAVFALRMLGWGNVKVLQGGLEGWKVKGGFEAYARAQRRPAK